ncbi:MAG: hypothetical protein V1844_08505 [Pseudomonadota bacterium]
MFGNQGVLPIRQVLENSPLPHKRQNPLNQSLHIFRAVSISVSDLVPADKIGAMHTILDVIRL